MSFCGASISSENLSGVTTEVTFRPCSGGTISLGTQVFPFNYVNEYYFGTYDCYVPLYDYVYTVEVPCLSETPTPTPTVTPTETLEETVAETPTPTPTLTPWDFCYELNGGFDAQPEDAKEDSSGKIVIGGVFTTYRGQSFNRIVRINNDGSIDNTFDIGTGFDSGVASIAIQPDGKILVGGVFDSYNGTPASDIVRLNNDGSLDNSFNSGTGFSETVWAVDLQSDNKILVGGSFTQYSGNSYNRAIRLNTDGSIDNSFTIGSGFNGVVYNFLELSDGKIMVVGAFTSYSGATHNRIVRLNNDGTIDNTFNSGTGFDGDTYSILEDDSGKMVIVGGFTEYNGITNRNIVRINSDGSFDNTFDSGSGFLRTSGLSYALSVFESSGKYYVVGDFNTYNGGIANGLIRLENDGSIDPTFNTGNGLVYESESDNLASLLSNEVFVVYGQFSQYKGSEVNDIAFINPFGTLLNCPYPTPTPTGTPTATPTSS
jgi:uncharacterized delta-60 repeat protein